MAEKPKVTYRIGYITMSLMVIVAFVWDLVEMGLEWLGIALTAFFGSGLLFFALNYVGMIVIMFILWTWFTVKKVPFGANPKRMGLAIITPIIEAIPGFDASVILGFGWTIGVILMILMSRAEDKEQQTGETSRFTKGLNLASKVKGKKNPTKIT